MSLHHLSRFGLLTKETTLILRNLDNENEFKEAKSNLYELGLTSSKSHATRIISEIKKRVILKKKYLPGIEALKLLAKANLNSFINAQIYFVYLYSIDMYVCHITNKLGEIFHSDYNNPLISRQSIKNLLITYLKSISEKLQKKTIENWIGRYLSIMREINILIRKQKHDYFMNFFAVLPETWEFFVLDSYFNNYPLIESEFFKSYQIKPMILPILLKNIKESNSDIQTKMANDSITIKTNFNNIQDWVVNLK